MTEFRDNLPQLSGELFLTDAGLETWLVFQRGVELRHFAAFELLATSGGRQLLREYYLPFLNMAAREGAGFVLETPTWRASPDWGDKLGYSGAEIALINRQSVRFMAEIAYCVPGAARTVLSGNIGPRGDGYVASLSMTAAEAEDYHALQIGAFATSGSDMVSAITMTNVPEAIGIARAAGKARMPLVLSFTVETDGRLPDGQPLGEAILATDAAAATRPAYYMVNCAHPEHFAHVLETGDGWRERIRGVRANASRLSHAELDEAETLDEGNPAELGELYRGLRRLLPNLSVLGGCCGTDHRHVEAIFGACRAAA
ncbi:homocysteine S-methyltransferase family protein [Afifella sp. IM 167]|uniref:homocysteine S-methyltransferase family protein n=1 Tax=Afifella sp. IM 167 TaxID=2033586 RepID=UPI001CC956FD|nr:homocysteine S-methyltransferase family protein [Afifella sp. IM 167]MBZ8134967.1 homocysteine S-methyltransferase [Afifella sp. IM 167]